MNGHNGYGDGYPDPGRSNRYEGGYGYSSNNNSSSNVAGSVSGRDRRAGGYGGFYGSPQPSASSLDVAEPQGRTSTSSSTRPRLYDVGDSARRRPGGSRDWGYGGSGGGSSRSVERVRTETNGSGETGRSTGVGDQRITGNFMLFSLVLVSSVSRSFSYVTTGVGRRKERQRWLTTTWSQKYSKRSSGNGTLWLVTIAYRFKWDYS